MHSKSICLEPPAIVWPKDDIGHVARVDPIGVKVLCGSGLECIAGRIPHRLHIANLAGAHSAIEHPIAKPKFIARHYIYGDEGTGHSFTGRV